MPITAEEYTEVLLRPQYTNKNKIKISTKQILKKYIRKWKIFVFRKNCKIKQ